MCPKQFVYNLEDLQTVTPISQGLPQGQGQCPNDMSTY